VQRIEAFNARFEFSGNAAFDELGTNGALHFLKKFLMDWSFLADFLLQSEESFGLEIPERQVLELATNESIPRR